MGFLNPEIYLNTTSDSLSSNHFGLVILETQQYTHPHFSFLVGNSDIAWTRFVDGQMGRTAHTWVKAENGVVNNVFEMCMFRCFVRLTSLHIYCKTYVTWTMEEEFDMGHVQRSDSLLHKILGYGDTNISVHFLRQEYLDTAYNDFVQKYLKSSKISCDKFSFYVYLYFFHLYT